MASSDSKKHGFFREFSKELKKIFADILFMYRNFFHWNLSKIVIFLWSLILGIIIALPIFFITTIVGLIDPVMWTQIAGTILNGQDPSFDITASFLEHPFWFSLVIFLTTSAIIFFFFGTSYTLLLLAKLSLRYVDRKKVKYKPVLKLGLFLFLLVLLLYSMFRGISFLLLLFIPLIIFFLVRVKKMMKFFFGDLKIYFSGKNIKTFLFITCLNTGYILIIVAFFLCLIASSRSLGLSPEAFDTSTIILILLCIGTALYVFYRIIFGFIILADQKKSEKVHSGRSYIKSSKALTVGKNIWKFLFLLALYMILMMPFNNYELYLEQQTKYMGAALAYKTGNTPNIDDSELEFYKYLSEQYSDMNNMELQESIIALSNMRIAYAIILYLVFGGLGVMLLASFYKRVLLKK